MRSSPQPFKNPNTPTITTPVGVDKVIQDLQVSYSNNLSWLEKSFGRAYIMSRKTDNKGDSDLLTRQDYIYPGLWQGNNLDMLDGLANDNLNAYSFFLKEGNETPTDYYQNQRNKWTVDISNIFWLNLKRIDSTKTYPFAEELLEEVKQVISTTRFSGMSGASIEIVDIFEKPSEIFQGFTLDLAETQHLGYPYHGFRILMQASYVGIC